jgi:hypothetical protein
MLGGDDAMNIHKNAAVFLSVVFAIVSSGCCNTSMKLRGGGQDLLRVTPSKTLLVDDVILQADRSAGRIETADATKKFADALARVNPTTSPTSQTLLASYTCQMHGLGDDVGLFLLWDVTFGLASVYTPMPIFGSYRMTFHIELMDPDDRRVLAKRDFELIHGITMYSVFGSAGRNDTRDYAQTAAALARELVAEADY